MRGGHEARARAAHVAGEGGPAAEAVRSAQARAQRPDADGAPHPVRRSRHASASAGRGAVRSAYTGLSTSNGRLFQIRKLEACWHIKHDGV